MGDFIRFWAQACLFVGVPVTLGYYGSDLIRALVQGLVSIGQAMGY